MFNKKKEVWFETGVKKFLLAASRGEKIFGPRNGHTSEGEVYLPLTKELSTLVFSKSYRKNWGSHPKDDFDRPFEVFGLVKSPKGIYTLWLTGREYLAVEKDRMFLYIGKISSELALKIAKWVEEAGGSTG